MPDTEEQTGSDQHTITKETETTVTQTNDTPNGDVKTTKTVKTDEKPAE